MAVSAFKSSSKRSNAATNSSASTTSSVGRQQMADKDNNNPAKKAPLRSLTLQHRKIRDRRPPAGADSRRGRSGLRNSDALGTRKEAGRSLSRVDPSRRNRSISRGPDSRRHFVNSKSDDEQVWGSLNKVGSDGKKGALVRSSSDELDELKGLRTWSSQHSQDSDANLSCLQSTNWEDGVSVAGSLSGAEEKAVKAVCERMNMDLGHSHLSVQGKHLEDDNPSTSIYETVRSEVRRAISEIQNDLESSLLFDNMLFRSYKLRLCEGVILQHLQLPDIADIPPDLVNPSAVELVLDIRREYAKKLEQSRERSRKLQSDLAVEEHRGQELSRILKEVLPDPKTSNVPKSRPGRKASIERRKMSKRLTEEAMSYFDECVSLSTFDSSDFSSPEDPPLNLVGFTTPVGKSTSLLQASSTAAVTNNSNSCHNDKQGLSIENQYTDDRHASGLMASSGPREPQISPNSANMPQDWKFSFAHKPTETLELQPDIMKYARHFEKGIEKDDSELQTVLFHILLLFSDNVVEECDK
ncbi:hypothetical protein GBA52_008499 [Prunus armeniaca]|nr:hypothetical protein GBA52_008499 [Prunus armeniaca]